MLLLSRKVAFPILGSAQIPQRLIAHSQIPKVGIWAALLKSGYHFGNLILAVSKSGYQNDNLILPITKPPEFSF